MPAAATPERPSTPPAAPPAPSAAPTAVPPGGVYRFGTFELDVGEERLRRDGRTVALRPQPARALALLLRRAGRLVEREELRQLLWGTDTYVDHEAGLNTCVRQIRRALGDDAVAPRFVQTVPGRGYRFLAAVTLAEPDRPPSTLHGSLTAALAASPWRARGVLALALLVASLASFVYLAGDGSREPSAAASSAAASSSSSALASPAAPPLVVVAFENRTGEERLDGALETVLRSAMGGSPTVRVLSQGRLAEALARAERRPDATVDGALGVELARREGARAVVLGRVDRVGASYLLTVSILDPASGDTVAAASGQSACEDLAATLGGLLRSTRAALGESVEAVAAAPPLEHVTTSDLGALRAYSVAQQRIWSRDHLGAVPFLQQAVERDPDFAMAHAWLAEILWAYQRPDESLHHAARAVAASDGLGESERLFVEASAAYQRGDGRLALRTWSLATALDPDDFLAHAGLAASYLRFQGDAGRARDSFLRALDHASDPGRRGWLLSRAAFAELGMGRFDDAAAHLRAAGELGYPWACSQEAGALLAARRHDEAVARLDACGDGEIAGQTSFRALTRILVALDRGDGARAVVLARRLEEQTVAGASGLMIAAARLARLLVEERGPGAHQAADHAADLDWVLLHFQVQRDGLLWSPLPLVAHVGSLAARDGDLETAQRALAHLDAALEKPGQRLLRRHRESLAAELDLAAGRPRDAVGRLEALIAQQPYPLVGFEALARAYDAVGQDPLAQTVRRRLEGQRGRALAEYPDDSFFDLVANVAAVERGERLGRVPAGPVRAAARRQ